LEAWLAYKSRVKYLESMNFAGVDEVAGWVREYYRDPQTGAARRAALAAEAVTPEG
jgi:hypothetical protein